MQKISVITVNFNHKEGLECTMRSVLSQDYADLEYIVIDGGSKDGGEQLLGQLYENDNHNENQSSKLKWVSEPDRGTYDAMNKGLAMATGDYVLFLNSGDVFASSRILNNVFAKEQTADLIVGRQYQLRNGRKHKAHKIYADEVNKPFLISNTLPHQATFIKRDLLTRLGGYRLDYKIVADWVFWYDAVVNHSASVSCIPDFVSVMEEEGISKDIRECRKEMAHYLASVSSCGAEEEWMERIEDNADAYLYRRAASSWFGRFLVKLASHL